MPLWAWDGLLIKSGESLVACDDCPCCKAGTGPFPDLLVVNPRIALDFGINIQGIWYYADQGDDAQTTYEASQWSGGYDVWEGSGLKDEVTYLAEWSVARRRYVVERMTFPAFGWLFSGSWSWDNWNNSYTNGVDTITVDMSFRVCQGRFTGGGLFPLLPIIGTWLTFPMGADPDEEYYTEWSSDWEAGANVESGVLNPSFAHAGLIDVTASAWTPNLRCYLREA